jgi:hypothetical protein
MARQLQSSNERKTLNVVQKLSKYPNQLRMKIENSNWIRLIGKWNTDGTILKNKIDSQEKITGTDSYELILDGNFILHQANVLMGGVKSETYELIQLENSVTVKMHYYNSNQESGGMIGFLHEDELKFESENLRFRGTISSDNTLIIGIWEQLEEDNKWSDFIEIKLIKYIDRK